MNGVNLLPSWRRLARLKRRQARRWTAICGLYAGLLVAACGACRWTWSGDDADHTGRELSATAEALAGVSRESATLRQQARVISAALDTARELQRQPDWGEGLALIARYRGDDLVLDRCRLDLSAGGSPNGLLAIGGFARSQSALSQFVLRLESAKLFQAVSLVKSDREPFLNGQAFAFRVECALPAASTPAGAVASSLVEAR